jgi:DNA polymerase-4
MSAPASRDILHVDMDAFYAAVEQRDRPELRGRPVLVGGSPSGRGVVSAASYEARAFGCRSAMPTGQALRLCPQAVVVPPRMDRYVAVSQQVFAILGDYTPLVEPLSIDEAFLDVTGSTRLHGPARHIAAEIRRRIRDSTGLTCSVGVARNMFLAKLASDLRKPDALVIVPADGVQAFLDPLPIDRMWGVGRVTRPRLEALGVQTFGDLRRKSEAELADQFGESGSHFHRLAQGIDDRRVEPEHASRSLSHEQTFGVDLQDRAELQRVLLGQVEQVGQRLRHHELLARTVVLKVRTCGFVTVTRRTTLMQPTDQTAVLWHAARELFIAWSRRHDAPVRLIGAGVAQLQGVTGRQQWLFDPTADARGRRLDRVVDEIRTRYGEQAIRRGLVANPAGGDRLTEPVRAVRSPA